MRNETSAYQNAPSEKLLEPVQKLSEAQDHILTRDELLRSNKELEQVAFAAAHDLQEPLRTISLYLQLFNRKYKGRLDDKADEMISFSLDRTERMQKLIQSILNYALVGEGNVRFTEINSNVALNQAIENLKVTIEENSAQIRCENCPCIRGDQIQLTRLFQNLIGNAIKFHKKGEPPCVHISAEQQETQWLFSIKDNGIGIKQEHLQNIFEPFRRLHSRGEYQGNGLGLGLCKRIVESHGGHIWAESEIGKGTTVYFEIPK